MDKFFIACALLLSFGILKTRGTARLIVFLTGIIFFQERIILFNIISLHQFLIYMLLAAEAFEPKPFEDLKRFPLITPLGFAFAGLLCVGMFDGRHGAILNIKRVADIFSSTFMLIFLFYANFKRHSDWKGLFNFLSIASVLLCAYGFYNFITKTNPYDSIISNTYNSLSAFDQYNLGLGGDGRFRINSFTSHPIYYGYLSGILMLMSLYALIFEPVAKKLYLLVIAVTFLNLILANSRTPLIASFIGLVIFIAVSVKSRMKTQILLYGVTACFILYNVPLIREKIDNSIDVFNTGGSKVSGSNLDMRTYQFNASYSVFKQNPLWGNGLYYIFEDLGFNTEENTADTDFEGFESYIYQLIIEQGLAGIVTNIVFFAWVIYYFLRNRLIAKPLAGLGLAIVIMFLVFIVSTGPLGTWTITMGILGILIARITEAGKEERVRQNIRAVRLTELKTSSSTHRIN